MQTFHEFVEKSLAEPAGERGYRYLLVDTAATRPLNFARACGLAVNGIDLLTGMPCVWRDSASPILIALPSASATPSALMKTGETLALWRYANCFVYLESPHSPDSMVQMLCHRTDAVLPQNLRVLLRYFDSRIFSTLAKVMNADQRTSFLAIASCWAVPDRSGYLQSWHIDCVLDPDTFESPITFDAAQEAALIDAGEVDAMIDLLLNQSNPVLLTMMPPAQFERIRDALANARKLGIDGMTDQVAYCSLDLDLGPHFFEEPPWSEDLLAVTAGHLMLSQFLGSNAAGRQS